MRILLGNGDGTFATPVVSAVGDSASSVAIGDLDNDGVMDLAVAGYNSVSILKGHGDGTFAVHITYHMGICPTAIAIGDLDGDGRIDVVQAQGEHPTAIQERIHLGTGLALDTAR